MFLTRGVETKTAELVLLAAELKRVRSDVEAAAAQADGDKQALLQALNAAQLEAQQALQKAISEHREEVERLLSEKVRSPLPEAAPAFENVRFTEAVLCSVAQEAVRLSFQMEQEAALRTLRQEAEEQLHRAKREREELEEELRTLQHDRDQRLLQAETEKQQVRSEWEGFQTLRS